MKDPTRWRTDPSRRPSGADLLLRGARRPRPPGSEELERLAALVGDIPRRSALSARRSARFTAAAAAIATLVALGTGVWAWRGRRTRPAPAVDPVLVAVENLKYGPAPARQPDAQRQLPALDAEPVAERHRAVRAAARPARHEHAEASSAEAASADTLAREIALIDAARSDLGAAPARALGALETHKREFPRGQLAAEREFLAVEALRRMNRTEEARRRAGELEVRYPSSSYAARAARLLSAP